MNEIFVIRLADDGLVLDVSELMGILPDEAHDIICQDALELLQGALREAGITRSGHVVALPDRDGENGGAPE